MVLTAAVVCRIEISTWIAHAIAQSTGSSGSLPLVVSVADDCSTARGVPLESLALCRLTLKS